MIFIMLLRKMFDKILVSENDILQLIISSLSKSNPLKITYLNQHCFNTYFKDTSYKKLVEDKFEIFLDGFGMIKAYNFLMNKQIKLFNATDLYTKLINYLSKNNIPIFIIGGNFEESTINSDKILSDIVRGYQNGFGIEKKLNEIVENIINSKTKIVICGMGVPLQEKIVEKLSLNLENTIFICVGNFFEFYFGTVNRIPSQYKNTGLEWIYRLFQEPKRLWKRYIIGIPLFIFRVMKFKLVNSKIG